MQIEMTIKGLMVDPITNMPIVILRDKDGQKVLPIWVGIFEANAIALQIENIATPRPMTHDLLRNVIHDLKASVQKIVVCDLQDNTFYALIYLSLNGETLAIAVDPKNVVVTIPPIERERPDSFISRVQRLPVPLLPTEARVQINERTGTMIITGDVEISPVVISHKGLTISTIRPEPIPTPRTPVVTAKLAGAVGPVVAVTDFLRAVPDQVSRWVPGTYTSLGTDGFGRSDTREALRRFFEVDAGHVVVAVLSALAEDGQLDPEVAVKAAADHGIDREVAPSWRR